MLDRALIEKVGAGLGLAVTFALALKMLLPPARQVQVDLWLHTQRLRLRRRLRPFWRSLRWPAWRRSGPVGRDMTLPTGTAPQAVQALPSPAQPQPSLRPQSQPGSMPLSRPRRRSEGEWSGNVFHARAFQAGRGPQ